MTKLAKGIFHSPLLREDLSACCTHVKVKPKLIKRSVPTRWNSVAEMVESALHLRAALDRLVEMDRHNTVAKTRLRKLKILTKEWLVLSQLTQILSVCDSDHFYMFICANICYLAFLEGHPSTVQKEDTLTTWSNPCDRPPYEPPRGCLKQCQLSSIDTRRGCKRACRPQ
jgi:hypothetical protein